MRKLTWIATLLLLSSMPVLAAGDVVLRLSVGGRALSPAKGTASFPLGSHPLGDLVPVELSACFETDDAPAGSCDSGGTLALDNGLANPFFLGGPFREEVSSGTLTLVNFPITLQPGQRMLIFVTWAVDRLGTVTDRIAVSGSEPDGTPLGTLEVELSGSGLVPGNCLPANDLLCLNDDRFKVKGRFLTSQASEGIAETVPLTEDTGYFWFFSSSNVETVLKVLNACQPPLNRYWVFAGGLTNVETIITVTDTQQEQVRIYHNPIDTPFQPVQDTQAFATCP